MENLEGIHPKKRTRTSKVLVLLLKIIGAVIIAIGLFLAIVFTVNIISNKSEQGKIVSYGQLVPVDGKHMNALIQGEGEETVVLLPGFGTASPVLDFKSLLKKSGVVRLYSKLGDDPTAELPFDTATIEQIKLYHHPATDRWLLEHEKQIKDSVHGKVMIFDGGHYLHRIHAKDIVENVNEFMKEIK
ncbi:hypothetical protein [Paenibacillus sp. NPDC057934]|uniref:hypothetical protein n=1 Tax=Paenibacillus sp. NPDC057934 TaxID=3346282 RepID=UPI0036DDFFAD